MITASNLLLILFTDVFTRCCSMTSLSFTKRSPRSASVVWSVTHTPSDNPTEFFRKLLDLYGVKIRTVSISRYQEVTGESVLVKLCHKSTGPRTISPPGGLPWILETVRVPYDFPFYRVCGHIFYGARVVPSVNWWSVIVRCSSTNRANRKGAVR